MQEVMKKQEQNEINAISPKLLLQSTRNCHFKNFVLLTACIRTDKNTVGRAVVFVQFLF